MITSNKIKQRQLFIGIVMDIIGCITYAIPGLGEFADIIWAPISAYILLKMYPGQVGRVAATVNFIEELSPGFDFIPTYTITWCYTYLGKKRD
ncbi:hypothetical protein HX017_04275 [Myroides marinus]|uniref:Uncharacterized protein n=1 Tax=Myroides marinus TaxID=703342 RepID=A0A1H6UH67_9FLAO|nr:hypothetical protein [Myroides marinus]MDM1351338.1 hypothetical protein [Myroides marinus]MDM1354026.1 hypothetical protein [Myroides marinus]MDM1358545.1 hypothetical protein [Myroides marinus]MDM1361411.1 hypothetical protein [Myroides marinus]MDM1364168.1 hypothetical protein [Myroides marinus]